MAEWFDHYRSILLHYQSLGCYRRGWRGNYIPLPHLIPLAMDGLMCTSYITKFSHPILFMGRFSSKGMLSFMHIVCAVFGEKVDIAIASSFHLLPFPVWSWYWYTSFVSFCGDAVEEIGQCRHLHPTLFLLPSQIQDMKMVSVYTCLVW